MLCSESTGVDERECFAVWVFSQGMCKLVLPPWQCSPSPPQEPQAWSFPRCLNIFVLLRSFPGSRLRSTLMSQTSAKFDAWGQGRKKRNWSNVQACPKIQTEQLPDGLFVQVSSPFSHWVQSRRGLVSKAAFPHVFLLFLFWNRSGAEGNLNSSCCSAQSPEPQQKFTECSRKRSRNNWFSEGKEPGRFLHCFV